MKITFRGRRGTIKFQGNEGRKLAEHVRNGGSLGDVHIPTTSPAVKSIEAELPMQLCNEGKANDEGQNQVG